MILTSFTSVILRKISCSTRIHWTWLTIPPTPTTMPTSTTTMPQLARRPMAAKMGMTSTSAAMVMAPYHLIASGGGKLSKGQQYGHYDSHEAAHDAVRAIIERNHSKAGSVREVDGWLINEYGQAIPKTAAPAADPNSQPTQIESQIEQLMQFWAVDNNGWWHWTGSQADLALLNQMQQQMMAVGMPGGPPGQMQAQSAIEHETDVPVLAAEIQYFTLMGFRKKPDPTPLVTGQRVRA